jgi:AcrR family transcriptional regulator
MTRLRAPQRREQLLDVAADIFAQQGYAKATTAELAKAAGVTEPIIYRHFDSKRDLFIALIERTATQTLRAWEERLRHAKDPGERLRIIVGGNPMTSESGRTPYRVFLQAITEVGDPVVRAAVAEHIGKLHAYMTSEVRRAQDERKVIRVFSPELIAWTLVNIGLGYGLLEALQVPRHGVDKQGHEVRALVERVLTRRGSED